jgi:hypothetical protein
LPSYCIFGQLFRVLCDKFQKEGFLFLLLPGGTKHLLLLVDGRAPFQLGEPGIRAILIPLPQQLLFYSCKTRPLKS